MNDIILAPGARLTAVHLKDSNGQNAGKVIEWLMDVEQGKVLYVVAELHGEENYFAIPWSVMKADREQGGYLIDVDALKKIDARVSRTAVSDLVSDKDYLSKLYENYNLEVPRSERHPSQNPGDRSRPSASITQTNAEMTEGKGYGG